MTTENAHYFPLNYWPDEAWQTPASSSVRQQVVTAIDNLLKTITVVNGYRTNLGANVQEWTGTAMDPNASALRIEYRDEGGTTEYLAAGEHTTRMQVAFRIQCQDNVSKSARAIVRAALADLYQALYIDVTFGGLTQDINQDGTLRLDYGEAADKAAGATITYTIEYFTVPGTP